MDDTKEMPPQPGTNIFFKWTLESGVFESVVVDKLAVEECGESGNNPFRLSTLSFPLKMY